MNEINPKYENTRKIHRLLTNQNPGFLCKVILYTNISCWGVTRIIQSIYYSPASRCINAWMHSLKKSVKPEIVNRYDLWVLRHKIGGAIKCL